MEPPTSPPDTAPAPALAQPVAVAPGPTVGQPTAPDAPTRPDGPDGRGKQTARRAASGRAAWTLADQALSSLTNAALSVLVARAVGADAFGAFSVALVTFTFTIGASRAVVTDPLVIRYSAVADAERRAAVARASGAAAAAGIAAAAVCGVAAVLLGGAVGAGLGALAVALPGLLVQDAWRYGFFASGRPAGAALNDLVWAVAQLALIGLLLARGTPSVPGLVLAWGGAAWLAAAVGCLQTGVRPRPEQALGWFREHRSLSSRLGADYVVNMGAVNVTTFLVGAVAGLTAVGALRAAQVLLGPLQLLFAGLTSFALPLLARRVAAGASLTRSGLALSGTVCTVSAVWAGILLLLPDAAGHALLGESWQGARHVLPASAAASLCIAAVIGASLSLKAMARAGLLLRVTLMQAPLIVLLGCAGAWWHGAVGAATGLAVAQGVGLVLSWLLAVRVDRARRGAAPS